MERRQIVMERVMDRIVMERRGMVMERGECIWLGG
jgi:hypothetical protein